VLAQLLSAIPGMIVPPPALQWGSTMFAEWWDTGVATCRGCGCEPKKYRESSFDHAPRLLLESEAPERQKNRSGEHRQHA
jgi:hypothetical protein